jgi:hypothetical protein
MENAQMSRGDKFWAARLNLMLFQHLLPVRRNQEEKNDLTKMSRVARLF